MLNYQIYTIASFAILNSLIFIRAIHQCRNSKNSLGPTPFLYPLGSFFWADAVVFSAFWVLVGIISLIFMNWYLFLLFFSIFWLVRSAGEVYYWFNQQFSKIVRNPPEKMFLSSLFEGDSIWFVYQIFWQCLVVFSGVSTIYLSSVWLGSVGL